ncbi:hypothetical protein [Natrinema caseinilyticum]|uniref:hypothetical protein n=1 Tax=Natrinema caseinilyticum TaxID=2961570 RepID=UPI0020C1F6A9|nr:hypothetical protein [Natrinema caseinilyticum]
MDGPHVDRRIDLEFVEKRPLEDGRWERGARRTDGATSNPREGDPDHGRPRPGRFRATFRMMGEPLCTFPATLPA